MQLEHLGPTQRRALLAALHTPGHALTRGAGGWWLGQYADGSPASFTARTVFAMGRAWLFDLLDPFTHTAPLTTQGLALAEALRDAAQLDKTA